MEGACHSHDFIGQSFKAKIRVSFQTTCYKAGTETIKGNDGWFLARPFVFFFSFSKAELLNKRHLPFVLHRPFSLSELPKHR